MKTYLLLLGTTAILGLALAQNNTGFQVTRAAGQGIRLVNTENTPRAATLTMRCVGANIEVVLDPKVYLNQSQAPLIRSLNQEIRWDFIPESGEVLLPASATKAFVEGMAANPTLSLTILGTNPLWEANFSTANFRDVFGQLPCNTSVPLGSISSPTTPTPPTPPPAATAILDATTAFIAPLEFVQVFGGRFAPENGLLVWEYNGIRLGLQVGKTTVQNLLRQTTFELPKAVQVTKNGRTVVPARVLNVFNCQIAPTKPTDATVRVTCGAGSTTLEKDLPRY